MVTIRYAGYLTGKYANGIPKDSRFSDDDRMSKWYEAMIAKFEIKGPFVKELYY